MARRFLDEDLGFTVDYDALRPCLVTKRRAMFLAGSLAMRIRVGWSDQAAGLSRRNDALAQQRRRHNGCAIFFFSRLRPNTGAMRYAQMSTGTRC